MSSVLCSLTYLTWFLLSVVKITLSKNDSCSIGNPELLLVTDTTPQDIIWKTVDWFTLPSNIYGTVSAFYDGNIFILGGKLQDDTFNTNIYYANFDGSSLTVDTGTSTITQREGQTVEWTSISPTLPVSAPDGFVCVSDCSVTIAEKIYITAPLTGNYPDVGTQKLIVFDMNTQQYVDENTYASDIPRIVGDACPVTDANNQHIYLTGGHAIDTDDNDTYIQFSNFMDVYDIENDIWTQGADLLSGRVTHACGLNMDMSKIYVFSGYKNSVWQTNIDSYTISTGRWEHVAQAEIPRNDNHLLRDSYGTLISTGGWANGNGYYGAGMNGGQLTEIFHESIGESCVLPTTMALTLPTLYYSALFINGIDGSDVNYEYDVFFIFGGRASSRGEVYNEIQYFILYHDRNDVNILIDNNNNPSDTPQIQDGIGTDHYSNSNMWQPKSVLTIILFICSYFYCV